MLVRLEVYYRLHQLHHQAVLCRDQSHTVVAIVLDLKFDPSSKTDIHLHLVTGTSSINTIQILPITLEY